MSGKPDNRRDTPNNLRALEITSQTLKTWWVLIAGPCIGLALGLVAMQFLPKIYEASTKILVSPPKIPQEYVRSTITDDMALRLAALKEAVLSRPFMETLIAAEYGLPEDGPSQEALMKSIRSRVEIPELTRGYFEIKFRDTDPVRAAKVVNILSDLYIEKNAQTRAARAEDTTSTLENFASDVLAQLREQEKSIAQFKAEHLYETPDHREANLSLLSVRRRDLEQNERAIRMAKERLELLRDQEAAATAALESRSTVDVTGTRDPVALRIARLRQELETARAKYLEEHPDVQTKKRELEELLAEYAPPVAVGDDGEGSAGAVRSPLGNQIKAVERELVRLEESGGKIRADIDLYSRRIENTPRIQQQLSELTKGYDILETQYRDYQLKAASAKGAQKIEESHRGEQFEIIERAVPPSLPVRPVPTMVYALGVAVGVLLFVGPPVAALVLNPVVCSEIRMQDLSPVPVLATIPRLPTASTLSEERIRRVKNVMYSLLSMATLATVILIKLLPRIQT